MKEIEIVLIDCEVIGKVHTTSFSRELKKRIMRKLLNK